MLFNFIHRRKAVLQSYCTLAIQTVAHVKAIINDTHSRRSWDLVPACFDPDTAIGIRCGLTFAIQTTFIPETAGSAEDRAQQFVYYVQSLSKRHKNAIYLKLASEIVCYLHECKMSENDYDLAVQKQYSDLKRKGNKLLSW